MKFHIVTALCTIATALISTAEVPSLINYQGRLTNANGDPVTGSKNFAISIYDAATNGTLLYTEDIGAVTLGDNGVYSFQFGGSGTSNTLVTETVATTDGTSTTFQKVLDNSPVVANSVSVSDGTYTWSQSAGSSNEDQFGVAYSTSLRRVTANYYNGAPAIGRTITATYRYGTSGITGALASGAEHWIAVSVNGTTQGVRQRVLAVPFASHANTSQSATTAHSAVSAPIAEAQARKAQEAAELALVAAETAKANISVGQTSGSWSEFFTSSNGNYGSIMDNNLFIDGSDFKAVERISVQLTQGSWGPFDFFPNAPVRMIQNFAQSTSSSQYSPYLNVSGTIYYADGSQQSISMVNSFGYYTQGQTRTMTTKADKPDQVVTKVTLYGSLNHAAQPSITLWVNSQRTLVCSLPSGFFSAGYEYKVLPTFASLESTASYDFQLLDSSSQTTSVPKNQWFTNNSAVKIRLNITSARSDSESIFTVPKGIVILKRTED